MLNDFLLWFTISGDILAPRLDSPMWFLVVCAVMFKIAWNFRKRSPK